MKLRLILLSLFLSSALFSQKLDTLRFFSEVFDKEREVYIRLPEDHKYKSDLVKFPVIYVLDGQHEWFANPVVNDIDFMKYVYEMPSSIVVVIPHDKRNKECSIGNLDDITPLQTFIQEEVEKEISKYGLSDFRLIIGHSLSASFAMYAMLEGGGFYSAVFAHTPMDHLNELSERLASKESVKREHIFISTGGTDPDKDKHHRRAFEKAVMKYPEFYSEINTYRVENATHNAVPIVATPVFLNKLFYTFSRRYSDIAFVDSLYQLAEVPKEVATEMKLIEEASKVCDTYYPMEIAEMNGIASRYGNSGFNQHTLAVFEEGTKYYPKYYENQLVLYSFYAETDKERAFGHLQESLRLVHLLESEAPDYQELVNDIEEEIKNFENK
ncbi:MAG: alpha/beta hydrolase-fold protein [Bacteroidota bacterium]